MPPTTFWGSTGVSHVSHHRHPLRRHRVQYRLFEVPQYISKGNILGISWSTILTVHGNGQRAIRLHLHLRDDSALSAEFDVGNFDVGKFWTRRPTREGSVSDGRGRVLGHILDLSDGVIFKARCPHRPFLWRRKRYAIATHTGVAWYKVPAVLQRRMHVLNFPFSTHFHLAHFLFFFALAARYAPHCLVVELRFYWFNRGSISATR